MKKFILTAVICFGIFLTACDGSEYAGDNGTPNAAEPPLVVSGTPELPLSPEPPYSPGPRGESLSHPIINPIDAAPLIQTQWGAERQTAPVALGANDFAFALSAALLQGVGDGNFVASPFSVWLPLAALANAVDEESLPRLLKALGAEGSDISYVNRAASRMMYDLTRVSWGTEQSAVHIANAIFVDDRRELCHDFAQTFMDYFRGGMMNVDFAAPDAVDAINQWASDNTEGRISNVIDELCQDTVAAIANAIFFSCDWVDKFSRTDTRRGTFNAPGGAVETYMMRQEWTHRPTMYFEDEHMQALTLSFVSGGGLTVMLPKNGSAVELLKNKTNDSFNQLHNNAVLATGVLELPRFSIESTLDNLLDALTALGLDFMFCQAAAPINGLLLSPLPLFINEATQKAMIEVDEDGATAAAVTVMVFAETSAPMPQATFEMICDRPFAFVLHRPTVDGGRQVLFTGVVNQP